MNRFLCSLATVAILATTGGVALAYNHSLAKVENVSTHHSVAKDKQKEVKNEKEEKLNQELPKGAKPSDWDLLLVNKTHPLPKNYKADLGTIGNYKLNKKVIPHYEALAKAAKKAGNPLVIVSSYRSPDYQEKIYQQQIDNYIKEGKSKQEAKKETADYMTKPGTSEHHTGLSLDVLGADYYEDGGTLEEKFAHTKSGKWLNDHCAEYGFIIRYPKAKEKITAIQYEPWHLRYVGKENAEYIMKHHLCLEEYIDELKEAGR